LEHQGQGNQSSIIDESPSSIGHVNHHSIWTVRNRGADLLGGSAENREFEIK
jgi:hypothetical protein